MAAVAINKSIPFGAHLLFLALVMILGCEKEDLNPDYPFRVVVKTIGDSTRAANTFVEAFAPIPGAKPYFEGYTNDRGEIRFTYDKEAVLFVRASRGPKIDYQWLGCSEVFLEANEEITKIVYIEPKQGNNSLVGCTFD